MFDRPLESSRPRPGKKRVKAKEVLSHGVDAARKDDKEKTRDVWVFPTYQYRREPGMVAHRIWPLFFYQNYGSRGSSGGLLPLLWVTLSAVGAASAPNASPPAAP